MLQIERNHTGVKRKKKEGISGLKAAGVRRPLQDLICFSSKDESHPPKQQRCLCPQLSTFVINIFNGKKKRLRSGRWKGIRCSHGYEQPGSLLIKALKEEEEEKQLPKQHWRRLKAQSSCTVAPHIQVTSNFHATFTSQRVNWFDRNIMKLTVLYISNVLRAAEALIENTGMDNLNWVQCEVAGRWMSCQIINANGSTQNRITICVK